MSDHLGTVKDLADDMGVVVNHRTYDSYGNLVTQSNESFDSRYGFTGREFDEETELHYYRARYYSGNTGRFISNDPIGFAAGEPNLYRYAQNNPLSFVDPSGLDVMVVRYSGAAGFGHIGIGVDTTDSYSPIPFVGQEFDTWGFYSNTGNPVALLSGSSHPGELRRDSETGVQPIEYLIIPTTYEQDIQIINSIDLLYADPSQTYALFQRTCATVGAELLRQGGISVESSIYPKELFDALAETYGRQRVIQPEDIPIPSTPPYHADDFFGNF